MFRDTTNSKIDPALFGVGSIMSMGNERYLVVGLINSKYVRLLSLSSFQLQEGSINTLDINFLSETEVRELGYLVGCTLSDFDLDSNGLKLVYKGYRNLQ